MTSDKLISSSVNGDKRTRIKTLTSVFLKSKAKLGAEAQTCNPRTRKAEAGQFKSSKSG